MWKAAEATSYPYGPLVKLLLLTGTRRTEASDARWPEFDLDAATWTIPPERFKSDRVHIVPLSKDAVTLLAEMPRWQKGDYLFSTRDGHIPIDGFRKAKPQLDELVAKELGHQPEPWVLHDLRRTVRTRLSQLRVSTEVAELVIGHARVGLHRVYDQHEFLDERREALELWAAKLRASSRRRLRTSPTTRGGRAEGAGVTRVKKAKAGRAVRFVRRALRGTIGVFPLVGRESGAAGLACGG